MLLFVSSVLVYLFPYKCSLFLYFANGYKTNTLTNRIMKTKKYFLFNYISLFWNHSEQHSSKTPLSPFPDSFIFWNHSEQHSSKTTSDDLLQLLSFWNHSEQHSSKMTEKVQKQVKKFWNHSEQHSSKTSCTKFSAWFRNRTICPSKTSTLNDSIYYIKHFTSRY